MHINKIAGIGLVTMGLGVAAVLGATPAQASEWQYLSTLENNGMTGPSQTWLDMGYLICRSEAAGHTPDSIAADIVGRTGAGIYSDDAYFIMATANSQLC